MSNETNATCDWSVDDATDGEIWETSCGNAFVFNDGGPVDNRMKFCCYCGKSLTESRLHNKDYEKFDE